MDNFTIPEDDIKDITDDIDDFVDDYYDYIHYGIQASELFYIEYLPLPLKSKTA